MVYSNSQYSRNYRNSYWTLLQEQEPKRKIVVRRSHKALRDFTNEEKGEDGIDEIEQAENLEKAGLRILWFSENRFLAISSKILRILMECIETKNSLGSKLQTCSILGCWGNPDGFLGENRKINFANKLDLSRNLTTQTIS